MSDTKVYSFGNDTANTSSGGLLASLIPTLHNRGIDTSYLMGLLSGNNNGGFFGNNGGFQDIIALIVIAAIFGNGNFGFGGNGNNSNAEREMIMSEIQRNGVDISQLATSLNCSVGQLQNGINAVATQIGNLTGQLGMSSQQIINSLQSGNAALASQICSSSCDLKQLIAESNYLTKESFCNTNQILAKGFSDIGYATAQQTCDIAKSIETSASRIIDGQRAAEMRELNREISERDRRISEQATAINNYQQTQAFGAMISQATQPIATALGALQSDVDGIKCKLPKTEVVNVQPQYVPVNYGVNVGLAPYLTSLGLGASLAGLSGNYYGTGTLWG